MKIFRMNYQKKWHIVDPVDNNHSLCRENYNANPRVVEDKEFRDEKLCNICMSRAYKRGYIGVYPKFKQIGINKLQPLNSHFELKRLYHPEKNYHETLTADRNNVITDQIGALTNQFFGFLIEELKGHKAGKWTMAELRNDLNSKYKDNGRFNKVANHYTKKQKAFWNEHFLSDDPDKNRYDLLEKIYPVSTYFKQKREDDYVVEYLAITKNKRKGKVLTGELGYAIHKRYKSHKEHLKDMDKNDRRN